MSLFPTTRPSAEPPAEPARPARSGDPVDPVAERIQARLAALESQPGELAPQRAPRGPLEATAPADTSADGIADLNAQLELLRDQLEVAFNEMEGRITAADKRAAAAEKRAEEADTRAQVASARAANVLYAVDDLAAELARAATRSSPDDVHRLRGAVDKLRSRLHQPD